MEIAPPFPFAAEDVKNVDVVKVAATLLKLYMARAPPLTELEDVVNVKDVMSSFED